MEDKRVNNIGVANISAVKISRIYMITLCSVSFLYEFLLSFSLCSSPYSAFFLLVIRLLPTVPTIQITMMMIPIALPTP